MKVLANFNLNQNELQNAVIHPLATAPANPKAGQIYYNSTDNFLYRYTGSAWGPVGVVYSQGSATGAVITGLSDTGTVTTTNVVGLTLTGYTPVEEGVVTAGMTMQQAMAALDAALKAIDVPVATTTTPKMDGTAAVGTETAWAKGDHVHPTDTSRQAVITGAASSVTTDNLDASIVVVSDANGKIAASAITATELGYLDGVTSNIQTQLDGKQATITGAATTIVSDNLDANLALVSDASGKVAASAVTATELGYLDGVTSNVQTQFGAITDKIPDEASSSNKLADKSFVESSISQMAATYVTADAAGNPFATHAALIAGPYFHAGSSYTPNNNDYAVVTADEEHPDPAGSTNYPTTRYIYVKAAGASTGAWQFQYVINNTPFTATQWAAVNSGANSTNIAQIATNTSDISTNATTMNNHIADETNPHNVTAEQVGLGNVDNVKQWADSNHPTTVSGYGITDAKIDGGVITLGSTTITPLTKVSLNGADSTAPAFYAPTAAGTSGQILTSSGSGAPVWSDAPEAFHKYTASNTALTASGGAFTWTIPAATHGISGTAMLVNLYEVATGAEVLADVAISSTAITITIVDSASAGTLAANSYKVVAIG